MQNEKQKNKRDYSWIFQLIALAVVVGFICLIVYTITINNKEIRCLKPYAEEYCKSQNHSYINHNLVYMTCSKEAYDPRMVGDSNVVDYWFSKDEQKKCGVDK